MQRSSSVHAKRTVAADSTTNVAMSARLLIVVGQCLYRCIKCGAKGMCGGSAEWRTTSDTGM